MMIMAILKFTCHLLVALIVLPHMCMLLAKASPTKPFRRVDPNRVLQRYSKTNQLNKADSDHASRLDKQMLELEKNFDISRWQDCLQWDNLDKSYFELMGLHRVPVGGNNFQQTCQNVKFALAQIDRDLQIISKFASDTGKLSNFNELIDSIYNMDEAGNLFHEPYAKFAKIVSESGEFAKLLENIQRLAPEIVDGTDDSDDEIEKPQIGAKKELINADMDENEEDIAGEDTAEVDAEPQVEADSDEVEEEDEDDDHLNPSQDHSTEQNHEEEEEDDDEGEEEEY